MCRVQKTSVSDDQSTSIDRHSTTPSTFAGNIYQSIHSEMNDTSFLPQKQAPWYGSLLPWYWTCLGGHHHLASVAKGSSVPDHPFPYVTSTQFDLDNRPAPNCVTPVNQSDFVKNYWHQVSSNAEVSPMSSFLDMFDVRQFCQNNQIQYTIIPGHHACATDPRTGKDYPVFSALSSSKASNHQGLSHEGVRETRILADMSCSCDTNRPSCIPRVPVHPERLTQNRYQGIRDDRIPPQTVCRTRPRPFQGRSRFRVSYNRLTTNGGPRGSRN